MNYERNLTPPHKFWGGVATFFIRAVPHYCASESTYHDYENMVSYFRNFVENSGTFLVKLWSFGTWKNPFRGKYVTVINWLDVDVCVKLIHDCVCSTKNFIKSLNFCIRY